MASFNKFNVFPTHLMKKVHDLDADAIKIYLSNVTPVASNTVKADIAEISAGNGYAGPIDISAIVTQNGATAEVSGTDQTVTASGGNVGPFRHVILYNDTPISPVDPLIGWYDYGSSITLQNGESLTIDFSSTILTLA